MKNPIAGKKTLARALRSVCGLMLAAAALLTPVLAANSDAGSFVERLSEAEVGDLVTFGLYEQDNNPKNGKEALRWIVLDVQDDRVLLLSEKSIDYRPMTPRPDDYDEGGKSYKNYWSHVGWEACEMREWLNGKFLAAAFSSSEQKLIAESIVRGTFYDNYYSDSDEDKRLVCSDTIDRVFLLSEEEVNAYFPDEKDAAAQATEYARALAYEERTEDGYEVDEDFFNDWCSLWWLRNLTSEDYYLVFDPTHIMMSDQYGLASLMVRPALWIGLTKDARTVSDTSDMRIALPPKGYPSAEALKKLTDEITLPKSGSYLEYYEYYTVTPAQGDSIECFRTSSGSQKYRRPFTVAEGTNVWVAAQERGYSCIMYVESVRGEDVARFGWVRSEELSEYDYY